MSTVKTYNIDTGDTTNLAVKTNGTTALTIDSSQNATFAGTVADATSTLRPLVTGTSQTTTSGTSKDFTGIPSWVKRITVMFNGVSTNGTSIITIQLGTSGGIETSGYAGACANASGTAIAVANISSGFNIQQNNVAASVNSGKVELTFFGSNTWTESGIVGRSDNTSIGYSSGVKTLAGTLDRIRITTVGGTDTFDAGSVNIMYE